MAAVTRNVKKLSKEFIDKKINEWAEDGVLGALSDLENMDKEENGEVSEDNAENLQKAALNGHSQQIASQKSGKKSKPWKKKKLQFIRKMFPDRFILFLQMEYTLKRKIFSQGCRTPYVVWLRIAILNIIKITRWGSLTEITRGLWHVLKSLMITSAFREASGKSCQKS